LRAEIVGCCRIEVSGDGLKAAHGEKIESIVDVLSGTVDFLLLADSKRNDSTLAIWQA
jgi:hypothetical protein